MVHRLLQVTSWVCCTLVVISFALFARDQLSGASKTQVNQLVAGVQKPVGPGAHHPAGQPRRLIDQVAHTLTSPFTGIVPSDTEWVSRGIPMVVALMVYGLGLGYLARYSRGLS